MNAGKPIQLALIAMALIETAIAKTVTLGPADNRTSICLVEGDMLVITLSSPVPSFSWKVKPESSSLLALMRQFLRSRRR